MKPPTHSTSGKSFHSKGFLEGINTLHDEIELAMRWQRPSILLAVHQTPQKQALAQQTLEKKLLKSNLVVRQVTPETNDPDVILHVCKIPNREKTIFFIAQLANVNQQTNGAVYRALNLHREHLVEQKICAVFWLTQTEAAQLPHAAPDFWAFRHRVVEFAPPRGSRKPSIPNQLFVWAKNLSIDEETRANYETQLTALPAHAEIKTRLALTLSLIQLNWQLQHLERFADHLSDFAALSKKEAGYAGWVDNLHGIQAFGAGEREKAFRHFEQAKKLNPANSVFMLNSAISAHGVGKNQAAIRFAKQAVKSDPSAPALSKALGWLYLSLDKPQDAVKTLETALEKNPNHLDLRLALAVSYFKNNQTEACNAQVQKIQTALVSQSILQAACLEILNGATQAAFQKLRAAYQIGALSAGQILQDINLRALCNLSDLLEIVQA